MELIPYSEKLPAGFPVGMIAEIRRHESDMLTFMTKMFTRRRFYKKFMLAIIKIQQEVA